MIIAMYILKGKVVSLVTEHHAIKVYGPPHC